MQTLSQKEKKLIALRSKLNNESFCEGQPDAPMDIKGVSIWGIMHVSTHSSEINKLSLSPFFSSSNFLE